LLYNALKSCYIGFPCLYAHLELKDTDQKAKKQKQPGLALGSIIPLSWTFWQVKLWRSRRAQQI